MRRRRRHQHTERAVESRRTIKSGCALERTDRHGKQWRNVDADAGRSDTDTNRSWHLDADCGTYCKPDREPNSDADANSDGPRWNGTDQRRLRRDQRHDIAIVDFDSLEHARLSRRRQFNARSNRSDRKWRGARKSS